MKIAIVSDSTAYLSEQLIEKYNIYIIPLMVVFGEEVYRENIDLTTSQFFEKVKEGDELPTTSQPSLGAFIELYESLAKKYDKVISIHLSKRLSGTYETSISAGKMVEGIEVYSYDSAFSAMAQGFYVLEAAKMVKEGKPIDDVLNRLDMMKKTMTAYFIVDDLSHLQRGGRLSGAQALVGSLLRIKPILHIEDGYIIPFEKVRTQKRAVQRALTLLEEDMEESKIMKVVFTHTNNEKIAKKLQEDFMKTYPEVETYLSEMGPVLGTHVGEKAIGLGWYK